MKNSDDLTAGDMIGNQKKRSGLAIASFVFGCLFFVPILGLFFSLIGVICGIVALKRVARSHGVLRGRKLAISGIVLGSVGFLLIFSFLAIGFNLFGGGVRGPTQRMYESFKIGNPISQFDMVKAHLLYIWINKTEGPMAGCQCLYVHCRGSECEFRIPQEDGDKCIDMKAKTNVGKIRLQDVPALIRANQDLVVGCDRMDVTVFPGLIPLRGSFSVCFNKAGTVVSLKKPYYWD